MGITNYCLYSGFQKVFAGSFLLVLDQRRIGLKGYSVIEACCLETRLK